MWRVKTVTKFKNSFFPVLIYWNDIEIHLGCQHSYLVPPPTSASNCILYDFVFGAIYEILHFKTSPVEPGRLQWKMEKLLWSQVELDNDPGDSKRFWSLTTTPETNKCP